MRLLVASILLLLSLSLYCQTENNPILLGKITVEDLKKAPYSQWFDKEYNSYEPNSNIVAELKKTNWKNSSIQIFLATWCGDTKREVPRFIKILDRAGFPKDKIELVAVNTGDNHHKQSPRGEDKGKFIFRIPTIIISNNGSEVNRIVEYPVESLEKDLLQIFAGKDYTSNYRSYPYIINWIKSGVLTDKNMSIRGLANQIRFAASGAGEITSAAYVLCEQGETIEAAALCRIAIYLYPENVNYYSCAYIFSKNGNQDEALTMIKKYLAGKNNIEAIENGLELYETIKLRKTKE